MIFNFSCSNFFSLFFFNRRYDRFEKKYNIGLHKYLNRKIITYATLIIFFLATSA